MHHSNYSLATHKLLHSHSLLVARNAQIGIGCKLRLKLSTLIKKWRLEFFTLVALFVGYSVALAKIRRASADKKRVKELVNYTIEHVRERVGCSLQRVIPLTAQFTDDGKYG